MNDFLDNLWRKTVFFVGDIKRINAFPWVTWATHHKQICYDEILEALPLIQYGDIGLHRDVGYLSNLAIPGFMKHAWIHVQDGMQSAEIVEATSEGVIKRNPIYPMFSDYTIILRPLQITDETRKGACKKAKQIVGAKYDHKFKFDIEKELKYYKGKEKEKAGIELQEGEKWIENYDHGFSCTEVVAYAWWHEKEKLRIYRKKYNGKSVITADCFINHSWKIIWASKNINADVACKMGLGEEGVSLIEQWKKT